MGLRKGKEFFFYRFSPIMALRVMVKIDTAYSHDMVCILSRREADKTVCMHEAE